MCLTFFRQPSHAELLTCTCQLPPSHATELPTVVPGFRALGFRALPGFRAQNPADRAWSVHKTLFGFKAPLF